jgi:Domain of unknown function (DUF4189)
MIAAGLAVALAGGAFACVVAPTVALAQSYDPFLQPYGPYGPDLRDQTRRHYQQRSSGGSWGCQARNRRTGAKGWSYDYSSRQAAVNRALRECGGGCRITSCSS